MSLADKLLERLKTINVEEAIDLMANVLCELQNETEKKDQATIKDLKFKKSILVSAFVNQKKKVDTLEKSKKEMTQTLENKQKEINKLKTLNYQNELRLQALEMQRDDDSFNYYH